MNAGSQETLIPQAQYARRLRPLLPKEAFQAGQDRSLILIINVFILLLGWMLAKHLDRWPWPLLGLYVPFAIMMGNSVVVLLFSTHDLLHGSAVRNPVLRQVLSLIGLAMLWMPPTLWKAVHNREHHGNTNSVQDPDRNYLFDQPPSWGKWIQNLFVPSSEVHPLWLAVGMGSAWGVHGFRNLTSVLFFNNGSTRYPVFSFTVSAKERRHIALETLCILCFHVAILSYLDFRFLSIFMAYFIPIWLGYGMIMFYVYTNHMVCQLTTINDPLINSVSVRVPKLFDLLHLNFSYHTEHHIFPGLNSDYYPHVQALLADIYPERFNHLDAGQAWQLLLDTPRHYLDATTFISSSGDVAATCPLSTQLAAEVPLAVVSDAPRPCDLSQASAIDLSH